VLLYVEAGNETALKVYRGLGFEVAGVDEQYALGPLETTAAIVKT
jgi:ribosomal protein S18 acetylase RimI-like enzyme